MITTSIFSSNKPKESLLSHCTNVPAIGVNPMNSIFFPKNFIALFDGRLSVGFCILVSEFGGVGLNPMVNARLQLNTNSAYENLRIQFTPSI